WLSQYREWEPLETVYSIFWAPAFLAGSRGPIRSTRKPPTVRTYVTRESPPLKLYKPSKPPGAALPRVFLSPSVFSTLATRRSALRLPSLRTSLATDALYSIFAANSFSQLCGRNSPVVFVPKPVHGYLIVRIFS